MLDRRRFLARTARLGALAVLAASAGPNKVLAAPGFQLFDAMRFDGKPDDLSMCGLKPIRMVYSWELWRHRDWDKPDLEHIENTLVPKLEAEQPDRIVLDVEHWEADEVDLPVSIVTTIKKHLPKLRVGYYSTVPVRDYWAFQPGKEGRKIVYGEQVKAWGKLADAVDDLYPSLYAFYDDRDGWMRMADGLIQAGHAIGKPIYPFLWPQYHDQNKKLALKVIEGDFWLQQLDKVKDQGCDGAVIWGSLAPERRTPEGKIARMPWDPAAAWWLQTEAFAKAAGLVDGTCT